MSNKLIIQTTPDTNLQKEAMHIKLLVQTNRDLDYLRTQLEKAMDQTEFAEIQLIVEKSSKFYLEIVEAVFAKILKSSQKPLVKVINY